MIIYLCVGVVLKCYVTKGNALCMFNAVPGGENILIPNDKTSPNSFVAVIAFMYDRDDVWTVFFVYIN